MSEGQQKGGGRAGRGRQVGVLIKSKDGGRKVVVTQMPRGMEGWRAFRLRNSRGLAATLAGQTCYFAQP